MQLSNAPIGCLIVTFFLGFLRESYSCCYRQLQWNKCGVSERRSYMASHLTGCIRSCERRGYCLSVSFNRRFSICKLYDSDVTSDERCVGSVFIRKQDFITTDKMRCPRVCLPGQYCGRICRYTECKPIPKVHGTIAYGNQVHVGVRVEYLCTSTGEVSHITCGKDGNWSHLPECPVKCPAIPDVEGAVIYGNAVYVGAQIVYVCASDESEITITCGEDGAWSSVPECPVAKPIGMSCMTILDCMLIERNSRCLFMGDAVKGSRCYCNKLYKYDPAAGTCVQVCSSFGDWFVERQGIKILHHVTDTQVMMESSTDCSSFCQSIQINNPAFSFNKVNGDCKCLSASFQQVMHSSPDFVLASTNSAEQIYDRLCDD